MFKVQTTNARPGTQGRRSRRLMALGCALALSVLLVGNVAARPLTREEGGSAPLVTPKLAVRTDAAQLFKLKLATTAGYRILVSG